MRGSGLVELTKSWQSIDPRFSYLKLNERATELMSERGKTADDDLPMPDRDPVIHG